MANVPIYSVELLPPIQPDPLTEKMIQDMNRQGSSFHEKDLNDKTYRLSDYKKLFVDKNAPIKTRTTELVGNDWTINTPTGQGVCLFLSIFSNLHFLNSIDKIVIGNERGIPDNIYNDTICSMLMVGLEHYFMYGNKTYPYNEVITTYDDGERFGIEGNVFIIQLEGDIEFIIRLRGFGGYECIYIWTGVGEYRGRYKSQAFFDEMKTYNSESLKNLLKTIFTIPYSSNTIDVYITTLIARAIRMNVCIIAPDKYYYFGMNGSLDVITETVNATNSIIIWRGGGAHYSFIDCLNRRLSVNYILGPFQSFLLGGKSAVVPKIEYSHGDIGAMENPSQYRESIETLLDLGFSQQEAERALYIFRGNIDQASSYLFSERDKDKSKYGDTASASLPNQGFADANPVITQPSRGKYAHGDLSAMENIKHSSEDMRDEPMREEATKKIRGSDEILKNELTALGYDKLDVELAISNEDNINDAINYLKSIGIKPIIKPELSQLLEMGFPEAASREALLNANNDVNRAYDILSSQQTSATPTKSTRIDIGNSTNPRNNSKMKQSPIFHSMLKKINKKTNSNYSFLNNENCENIDTLSNFLDENDIEHDVGAIEREMFLQKGYDPGDIDEAVKIYNNCQDVDKFLSELKEIRQGNEIGQLFDFVHNDEDGYIKSISLLEGKNLEKAKQFVKELNKQTTIILGIKAQEKAQEEVKNFRNTLKSLNLKNTISQEFIDRHIQDYYDKNKEKYRKAIYATYKKNGNHFLDTEQFIQFMTANRLAGGKPRKSRRKIRNKSKRKNRNKSRSKQLKPRQKTGRVKYRRTRKH